MSSQTIAEVHPFSSTYFSQGDHPFGKRLSSPSLVSIALTTAPTTNTNSDCDYETSSEGFHSHRGQHALSYSKISNSPTAPLSSCFRTLDTRDGNLVPKFSSEPFVPRDDTQKILCKKFANFNSPRTLDRVSDTNKVKSLPEIGYAFNSSHDFMELRRNVGDFTHEESTNLQMLSGSASVTESHYQCDKKNDDTELRFTISNGDVVFRDGYPDKTENSCSCLRGKRGTVTDTKSSTDVDSIVQEEIRQTETSSSKRKKKYVVLSRKYQYFQKPRITFGYYPVSRIEGEFAQLQNRLSEIQGKVRALSLDRSMAYGDCAKRMSILPIGTLDCLSVGNLKTTRKTLNEGADSRKNYLNKKSNSARSSNDGRPWASSVCTNFSIKDPSSNIELRKDDTKKECKEQLENRGAKRNYKSEEISFLATLTVLARESFENCHITNKDESLLSNDNLKRETSKNCSGNISMSNEFSYKILTNITDETDDTWPKECARGMRSYPYQ